MTEERNPREMVGRNLPEMVERSQEEGTTAAHSLPEMAERSLRVMRASRLEVVAIVGAVRAPELRAAAPTMDKVRVPMTVRAPHLMPEDGLPPRDRAAVHSRADRPAADTAVPEATQGRARDGATTFRRT